jgi:hypothetical protein
MSMTDEIKDAKQQEKEQAFRELHQSMVKLIENQDPPDCFVSIVSIVGQLLFVNFDEDEYCGVLAKMSVDILRVTQLLHDISDEMEEENPSMAVH